MAFGKIIEFDKNNRYKVKLEVGNVDTSTVSSVVIDNEFCFLEQQREGEDFSFWTLESYIAKGEVGLKKWECEYSFYRLWHVALKDGELVTERSKDYE